MCNYLLELDNAEITKIWGMYVGTFDIWSQLNLHLRQHKLTIFWTIYWELDLVIISILATRKIHFGYQYYQVSSKWSLYSYSARNSNSWTYSWVYNHLTFISNGISFPNNFHFVNQSDAISCLSALRFKKCLQFNWFWP